MLLGLYLHWGNTEAQIEIFKKLLCLFNFASTEINGKIVSARFAFAWGPFIPLWQGKKPHFKDLDLARQCNEALGEIRFRPPSA